MLMVLQWILLVIGYLPIYFTERGSASPHALLGRTSPALRMPDGAVGDLALIVTLAAISLYFVLRPAQSRTGDSQVHLCAFFVRAGRMGLKPDGWALLLLITSGSTLGYTFLPV
jgi:hypothetical protein